MNALRKPMVSHWSVERALICALDLTSEIAAAGALAFAFLALMGVFG